MRDGRFEFASIIFAPAALSVTQPVQGLILLALFELSAGIQRMMGN